MRLTRPSPREIAVANASKKFGRYGPEGEEVMRSAEVSADELGLLRKKREMLRSMMPEQALAVIEFHERLNFFDVLTLAKREGKIIVPNYVHDRILTEIDDVAFLRNHYPVWTGTFVIYEAPNKPFGEKGYYGWEDYYLDTKFSLSLAVPEHFRGKKDCVLVVEHPDFDLVAAGNNRFNLKTEENSFHLLENFPKKSGKRHDFDERFRIPVGSPKRKNHSMRFQRRWHDVHVGPVARGFVGGDYGSRQGVGLFNKPSNRSGVALF